MNIVHDVAGERFVLLLEDGKEGGRLVFEHDENGNYKVFTTFVSPEYRGKGVAKALFDAFVKHVRQQKVKIVPVCSFVADMLGEERDKYADVIA